MIEQIQKITIKSLFAKHNSVFMLQQASDGKWELPGGTMNFGELPEDALKREIKEELGLDNLAIGRLINAFGIRTSYKTTKYQFVAIIYECDADLSNSKISNEHVSSKWIEVNQLGDYPMLEEYKETIRKYYEMLG